jgi:gas vesicle protein
MTKNSKLALGILGAVAAGVAIGILIAPEKGKDMRKKIRKTASKWTDEMTHLFERGKDKLTKSDLKGKAEMMKESLS